MNKKGIGDVFEIFMALILIVVVFLIFSLLFYPSALLGKEQGVVLVGALGYDELNRLQDRYDDIEIILQSESGFGVLGDVIANGDKNVIKSELDRIAKNFESKTGKIYQLDVVSKDEFDQKYQSIADLTKVVLPDKNGEDVIFVLFSFEPGGSALVEKDGELRKIDVDSENIEKILRELKSGEIFTWEGRKWIYWGFLSYKEAPISAVGCPCGEVEFNLKGDLVCKGRSEPPSFNGECFISGERFILGQRPEILDFFDIEMFRSKVRDILNSDKLGEKIKDASGRELEYWGDYGREAFSEKTKEDSSYWLKIYNEECGKFIECKKTRFNDVLGREVENFHCESDERDYVNAVSLKRHPNFILRDNNKCFVTSDALITGGYK